MKLDLWFVGSPWDEDKAMMSRWGLEGMKSFSQVDVARKEGARLTSSPVSALEQITAADSKQETSSSSL